MSVREKSPIMIDLAIIVTFVIAGNTVALILDKKNIGSNLRCAAGLIPVMLTLLMLWYFFSIPEAK